MSVRERAGSVWAEHERVKRETEDADARLRTADARARTARAARLLSDAPLRRWFPDATWSIVDFTGVGTSLQYQSDGSDIIVESDDGVLFGLSREQDDTIKTSIVKLVKPSAAYAHEGHYYSGPEVKSVLEIGRWLKANG